MTEAQERRFRVSFLRAFDLHEDVGRAIRDKSRVVERDYTRETLAHYFTFCGLRKGAEIGVERGKFSEYLCLAQEEGNFTLYCVDAWKAYPGYREHVTQAKLEQFYAEAKALCEAHGAQVIRKFSVEAAQDFADGSLDYVYIDANHQYDDVTEDISAWAPTVRSGGIVSGHDYGRGRVGQVEEAVNDWTRSHCIEPLFILRGDRSPSWFYIKP